MYEELVKSLRVCGRMTSVNDDCIAYVNGCCDAYPDCTYSLMDRAADAIEKLQLYEGLYRELAEKNGQTARKLIDAYPRWISVEERLPEEPGAYLIYIHDPEITPEYDCSYVSAAFYDKDEGLWKEEDDVVYCADLRSVNRGKVFHITHWMPLPEPPEEE